MSNKAHEPTKTRACDRTTIEVRLGAEEAVLRKGPLPGNMAQGSGRGWFQKANQLFFEAERSV